MSAKSNGSSTRKTSKRSLRADTLVRASKLVEQYQVILSFEDGDWYGRGLEMPQVFADGKTPAECIRNTRAALAGAVAYLLEAGEAIPRPAREGTRTEQVNVRLTPEEKAIIEAKARSKGFVGMSDFIRAAALESAPFKP